MEKGNTQHTPIKKPGRWLFNSETDYDNLNLDGLDFDGQDQKTDLQVFQEQPSRQKKMKKIEELVDPQLLPKAYSRRNNLSNRLLLYTSPIETNQRVITKLDKEAKPALFAVVNLQLEHPPHTVLFLNSGDATIGLSLALTHPRHTFYLLESNASQQRLTRKNVRANEEITPNVSFITETKQKYKSIIAQTQSYTSKDSVLEDIITSFNALRNEGSFYLLTRKQYGGQGAIDYIEQTFGVDNTNLKKGMGGYMLISAVKKEDSFVDKEVSKSNSRIEFDIFGKTLIAETPGSLFSKEGLNDGTRLLLESTEKKIAGANKILDLGCGWGAISISVLSKRPDVYLAATDVLPKAVQTTKKNLKSLNVDTRNFKVLCSFNPRSISNKDFDLVLSNPPYHERTDVLKELFRNTMSVMQKRGELYIVVENTYLDKFVDILQSTFGNTSVHTTKGLFTILKSKK